MNRADRLAIVARVCNGLWARMEYINASTVTDHVCDDPAWRADGYAGMQPWSRANRYVREYIRSLKEAREVDVKTEGSDHYNNAGTYIGYRLVGRTPPLCSRCGDRPSQSEEGMCLHCYANALEAALDREEGAAKPEYPDLFASAEDEKAFFAWLEKE